VKFLKQILLVVV